MWPAVVRAAGKSILAEVIKLPNFTDPELKKRSISRTTHYLPILTWVLISAGVPKVGFARIIFETGN